MSLKDVAGHNRAVNILQRTLYKDRIPSAYLFAGESGIGKKFTAINLAKAINCLSNTEYGMRNAEANTNAKFQIPKSEGFDFSSKEALVNTPHSALPDACDECSSCIKIDAGTHPDLLLVSPEKGEIRVDEIRAVEEALSFRPYEGIKKIVVIDDADAMNQSAANAFLKTLEEPPAESLVILIASSPDRLPETIRSRACRINFAPLSAEACEGVIRKQLLGAGNREARPKAEKTDESQIPDLVRLSMGRPGLAISSDLLKERKHLTSLFREMASGNSGAWADRAEMEQWLDTACILMRDMAVLKITGNEGRIFNPDIKDYISDKDKADDIKDIIQAFGKIIRLKETMGFNLNTKITWNYAAFFIRAAIKRGRGL